VSILITGAHGQVGRELAVRAGSHAIALSRSELDLTDKDLVLETLRKLRPNVAINAAAYTAVDKAEEDAAAAFAANRDGLENLAHACLELGIPLLHLSTDYVFDGQKINPYNEEDAPNPQGVYARSKWEGEQRVRKILAQHIILRVSWVFSTHGNNFVKTILRLANTRPDLRIIADQRGGPTPAAAIADSLLHLAKIIQQGRPLAWGTYHYAGVPETTWHGFAAAIVDRAAALGMITQKPSITPITTAEYPLPAPRPSNSSFDCARAAQSLGLSPPNWQQGLDEVLNTLARNPT
jgi:dTDP-4-dehydrorhamnose reductase